MGLFSDLCAVLYLFCCVSCGSPHSGSELLLASSGCVKPSIKRAQRVPLDNTGAIIRVTSTGGSWALDVFHVLAMATLRLVPFSRRNPIYAKPITTNANPEREVIVGL